MSEIKQSAEGAMKRYWHWPVFVAKVYILAVLIALVISNIATDFIIRHNPSVLLTDYWDLRLQWHILAEDNARKFVNIEYGYGATLVILLAHAVISARMRNKTEVRGAIFFAVVAVVLMLFFYLFGVIPFK